MPSPEARSRTDRGRRRRTGLPKGGTRSDSPVSKFVPTNTVDGTLVRTLGMWPPERQHDGGHAGDFDNGPISHSQIRPRQATCKTIFDGAQTFGLTRLRRETVMVRTRLLGGAS